MKRVAPLLALSLFVLPGCKPKTIIPVEEPGSGTEANFDDSKEQCKIKPQWVSNPDPPKEVPGLGGQKFCDFHQFAWEWFLQLMSPSASDSSIRNFQDLAQYPTWNRDKPQESCTAEGGAAQVSVRTVKSEEPFSAGGTHQAGGSATIFDQNGNVVFYDVRFSRELCDAKQEGNLPKGTKEMKAAWRIIEEADKDRYVWMNAEVDAGGESKPVLLGLVGFHLAISTELHPEMVWATWEHIENDPDCSSPQATPAAGWSFTSAECAECLAKTDDLHACADCNFNTALDLESGKLTGTPTNICRLYADGTEAVDPKADVNLADIDAVNVELIGEQGYLTKLDPGDPMAVLRYYRYGGSLWLNDLLVPSSEVKHQRGSNQLENTVLETTHQQDLNCFTCHNYKPHESATSGLSHIFDSLHAKSE